MSSNNNITVAFPGAPNWEVWLDPTLDNFQLDIVGFLAVLGESSVLANAQVSALSRLFYLPRILPAPQALIRTSRPTTLPPATAKVTGVHSGNVKDHVHHVANILLGRDMPTFTVRCVSVTKKVTEYKPTRMDTIFRGQPGRTLTRSAELVPPLVKAKATGPLSWVTLFCFFESIVLLVNSIVWGDGWSIMAVISLSALSTVVGISNKWNLKLPKRARNDAPEGDVVIRYPNGSYLIVKCDEDIARELYFAPEEIDYDVKNPATYRMLSLLGTLMLMFGIIALANAKLQLQFAWLGAYVLSNVAHWIAAALPQKQHWDLTCYDVKEQSVEGGPKNPTFTEALWKAILITKSVRWVRAGEAAPQTQVWDDWLSDAEAMALNYSKHVGKLNDPIWKGDGPFDKDGSVEGDVWDQPPDEVWNAKRAWDRLNNKAKESAQETQRQKRESVKTTQPIVRQVETV